jgi:hypothetical protein
LASSTGEWAGGIYIDIQRSVKDLLRIVNGAPERERSSPPSKLFGMRQLFTMRQPFTVRSHLDLGVLLPFLDDGLGGS